ALGGKYYGARNALAFHDTIKRLFVWGVIMIVGFTLIYLLGGKSFLSLLTNDTAIITASLPYLPWAILIPAIGMTAFVWDGVFIGITATRGMLVSSAIATILFFVCYYTLKNELGNHALWLAFILYLASRGIVQTYLFPKTIAGKI
ncbi:MATE family efflux transporter, partial [Bacteroides heparinolyticus]|uniref:MATE family efflux transporter n=1 Tax=Prevotella heparinolytica TaxID=28113 RepID=UPI00359FE7BF